MTFQVGIVGTDGIVLASDLFYTYPAEHASTRHEQKPKIFLSDDGFTACCASGDDVAGRTAELCRLMPRQQPEFWRHLMKCGELALNEIPEEDRGKKNYYGDVLAIDRTPQGVSLHHLHVKRPIEMPLHISIGHTCQGDRGNPAGFFLERYIPDNRNLPMKDLIFTAAHAVLIAGAINRYGVQGLEVMLCTRDGFRLLTKKELSGHIKESRRVDSEIARSLGLPVPRFPDYDETPLESVS